jgi:spore maturation protein CgeB
MRYDKLAGATPRVLILESDYWLDVACARAGKAMGWEIESVPVKMAGHYPREEMGALLQRIAEFRPDFLLTINMSGMDYDGLLARLFEDLALPYVTWFVDNPRTILMGLSTYATANSIAVTWDASYIPYFEALGFPVVAHLPLGVDDTAFNHEPPDTWSHPPTFIGYSNTGLALEEWEHIQGNPALAEAAKAAVDTERVTRATMAQGIDAILPEDVSPGLNADERRHVELYFYLEQTRRTRTELAKMLAPEGMDVRGDLEWQDIIPDALGPVHYKTELAGLYRDCEFNVNITSLQMPTTVNQRVFDCPAAGGFLLTDAQSAMTDLFDCESEMACYSTMDECRELFRFYRTHPKTRREMTERARARVLGEHTYRHRLELLVDVLREGARLTP